MSDTNTDPSTQQPNPAATGDAATEAAKPNGEPGTDPGSTGGQGEGGEGAGGDAGAGEAAKDGKAGDGPDKLDDAGPPEAYADFTLPDGFTLDGDRKDATLALFRELGLSQERGQKAIDHFIKTVGEDETVRNAAAEAAVAQQREDWAKQAKTELGDQYDKEISMARTAVQAMQNPKLVQAFDEQGWGNHPELIKAFAFFGRMMRDSGSDGIGSPGAADAPKKPWETLYGESM